MTYPRHSGHCRSTWALLAILLAEAPAGAISAPEAQPAAAPQSVPAPRDLPYPGQIEIAVDVTDVEHRLFKVHETVPVRSPGDQVLLFPKWIPGTHGPEGDLPALAGLVIHGGQTRLAWRRDPLNVYAFHVQVPKGASQLEVEYQYLSANKEDVGTIYVAHRQLMLDWQNLLLYPAGYFARDIQMHAQVIAPKDWKMASALETESSQGATTTFKPVSLEVLIDSPVEVGIYLKRYALTDGNPVPVYLDVMAEDEALTEIKPEIVAQHRAAVQQAISLFGSHHFNHYDFLYSVNDMLGYGVTVEHQRSAEYSLSNDQFTDWDSHVDRRDDLVHEFIHSWDGKFRRPADLWIANFNEPMRNTLLWLYEGGTQYWGLVVTARAGLWSKEQARDAMGRWIAELNTMPGRMWRDLQDTTNDEIINPRRPMSWESWQRFEDYYAEGALIWLDADTLIRERSGGKRSLDDFARGFFGVEDGRWSPLTYTFDDIVHALNAVEPYDWATFLRQRLDRHGADAPLDGLTRGGYRLIYTDTPSELGKASAANYKHDDFYYSLGFTLGKDGAIGNELWDSPAFKAGLAPGTRVIAVNNVAYDAKLLTDAVQGAKNGSAPIELLVRNGDLYQTVRIDYHGGMRFPHLEAIPGTPARLDDILSPRP